MTILLSKTRIGVYFIASILLLFTSNAKAQFWLSNEELHQEAHDFFEADEFKEALPLFQLLEKKEELTPNVQYKMGACYLHTQGQKHTAIRYLEKAVKNTVCDYQPGYKTYQAPLDAYMLLGIAFRIDGQFEKAVQTFRIFSELAGECKPELIPVIDMQINRCVVAQAMLDGKSKYQVDTLRLSDAINNPYHAILLSDSSLYLMNELKFYDALNVLAFQDGQWTKPDNLTPAVGSDGDHLLVGASSDGKQLLLYGYDPLSSGDIYLTRKDGKGWSNIEKVKGDINTPFNETHASFSESPDGILFTSNRSGGLGGSDIYFAKLASDGTYEKAINLGYPINTPYDEIAPFYNTADSSLYFCSQGHTNMGGFDVFVAHKTPSGQWMDPVNMGFPISTPDDDEFFYPTTPGSGIRSLQLNRENRQSGLAQMTLADKAPETLYLIDGEVSLNDTICGEALVAVLEKIKRDTISVVKIDSNGQFNTLLVAGQYRLIVMDSCGTLASKDLEITSNNPLDKIDIDFPVLAASTPHIDKTFAAHDLAVVAMKDTIVLHDLYFAFDEVKVNETYSAYLDSVANTYREKLIASIIVEGHTDSKGPENYNAFLSAQRAKKVADELIHRGVPENTIKIVGKGETEPKARSIDEHGGDILEGRKYNRRVRLILEPIPASVVLIILDDVPVNLKIE